jgi:hypothetical protein
MAKLGNTCIARLGDTYIALRRILSRRNISVSPVVIFASAGQQRGGSICANQPKEYGDFLHSDGPPDE